MSGVKEASKYRQEDWSYKADELSDCSFFIYGWSWLRLDSGFRLKVILYTNKIVKMVLVAFCL